MIYFWICFILTFLLGIAHIIYDICVVNANKDMLIYYLKEVNKFYDKFKKNKDNSAEVNEILKYSSKISDIMGEDIYDCPCSKLKTAIKYQRTFEIDDIVHNIMCNIPETEHRLEEQKSTIKMQLLNPFIWFYRGVEWITTFVLGYFVKTGVMTYKGKIWNAINSLVTFLSALVAIIEFALTIFGKTAK